MSITKTIGSCTLYLGDCNDILPTLTDIDLCVTSPPYDNLRTYEGSFDGLDWQSVIKNLYPAIKPGGVVMWNVADATVNGSETGTSFRQALAFMDAGFRLHDTMIYAKHAAVFPDAGRYGNAFEYMFVFSAGKPKTVNLIKDKKNVRSGQKLSGYGRKPNGEIRPSNHEKQYAEWGARLNYWIIGHDRSCPDHPATMPYAMAHDHILTWSNPGDTVLDPFAGSGTTGIACIKTGRKFIGIEREPKYFELMCERLTEAMKQPDLFLA